MAYTVYDFSTLALAVYDHAQTVVGEWKQADTFGDPKAGGFFAALYTRGQQAVLAYRGTDDGWDISPDAQIALGQIPCQMPHAELAFTRTKSAIKKVPLALTGHSLGGGLACLIAAKMGFPCVTFNAPGVARSYAASFRLPLLQNVIPFATAPEMIVGLVKTATLDSSKIINIRASYDVVSIGTGPQLGRVDHISVAGCQAVKVEKLKGGVAERLLSPGVMVVEGGMIASKVAAAGTSYVLCQHGMGLMEQQIRNMPEYQRDLGW